VIALMISAALSSVVIALTNAETILIFEDIDDNFTL
jgi:hypothetical protein